MFEKVTVCLDMAGCPNRCRHCWLGVTPNGRLYLNDLQYMAEAFHPFAKDLSVCSWYREPDYLNNYQELFALENHLSATQTPHFELMSFWRAVRDPHYVPWLRELNVKACQLTLFGTEETTDYHCGRKGAYQEILKAADLLLKNGIAPRFQVFIHQENVDELPLLEELFVKREYAHRVKDIGRELAVFVHQGSCDGESEKQYGIWLTPESVKKIPDSFAVSTLKHFQKQNLFDVFGQTEEALYGELATEASTQDFVSTTPVFFVDKDFYVYPNISTPSPWWRLGHLKTDGCKAILKRYAAYQSPAQRIAKTVPIGDMVKAFGNESSQRLFLKDDYLSYLLNRYCQAHWKEWI